MDIENLVRNAKSSGTVEEFVTKLKKDEEQTFAKFKKERETEMQKREMREYLNSRSLEEQDSFCKANPELYKEIYNRGKTNGERAFTVEEFNELSLDEQDKLYKSNPEKYMALVKETKDQLYNNGVKKNNE